MYFWHTVTAVFKTDSLILRLEIINPLCQKTTEGARIMKMAVISTFAVILVTSSFGLDAELRWVNYF